MPNSPMPQFEWFEELVHFLRCEGYICTLMNSSKKVHVRKANTCLFQGHGVRGGFTRQYPELINKPYPCLIDRLAADNERCFDKWSKTPLVIKLPTDHDLILLNLKQLGSEYGYKVSNSYDYLDNNPWPYEL